MGLPGNRIAPGGAGTLGSEDEMDEASEKKAGSSGPDAAADSEANAKAAFEESMKQFAEGATALTAASIRMQMMMLEQAREMMGDFADAFGDAQPADKEKS